VTNRAATFSPVSVCFRSTLRSRLCVCTALAILASIEACGESLDLPTVTPAVIQGILVAGRDSQFVWVEYATPPDSSNSISGGTRPVSPADVSLQLDGSQGSSWPLSPTMVPAQHVAQGTAVAGASYRLHGVVAGAPIDADCHVPMPVAIAGPDTLRIPKGDSVRLFWGRVPDAPTYGATTRQIFPASTGEPFRPAFSPDTSILFFNSSFTSTRRFVLYVMAIDRSASSFFEGAFGEAGRVRGNIAGALGVCGGMSVDSVLVDIL
jgi:hypothetical protein